MTNRETIQTILLSRKQDLLLRYHLKAIEIFGSCTREDFREDSDVDILIELKTEGH
jgi:predicted nucleotidyltransferase